MNQSLRQSMAVLHNWAGVIAGGLLFVIFWMGSLSVFDNEIDRWMMPSTRLAQPASMVPLDQAVPAAAAVLAPGAPAWFVTLPDARTPVLRFGYRPAGGTFTSRYLDPANGRVLPDDGSLGGTGFIFPFHFSLHLKWKDVGYWLVGMAAMAMLVLLVSGVIIHKKIFREFFTFRPHKQRQRVSLDLHNLTGVLALPFHFVIALSGLFIFFSIYFPWPTTLAYQGDKATMQAETYGMLNRPKSGTAAPLASLDAMVLDAEARWAAQYGAPVKADSLRVVHPGDAAGLVIVRSLFPGDAVGMDRGVNTYDAATGKLVHEHYAAPVRRLHAFLAGLHFIQFDHWTLRWLYFLAGLSGCVMIGTGLLFWIGARRVRHERLGLRGVPIVTALAIGSITGSIIATFAFFAVNRVLPASPAGFDRAELEMWTFFAVWCGTFLHAWLKPANALAAQAWALAAMAVLAVLLNWSSTGDHIVKALAGGRYAVAGMDCMLLAAAGLGALIAMRLRARAPAALPAARTA